jgi:endonuclease/exonuclease/phosphatase (EEP) superfamily protein YafD
LIVAGDMNSSPWSPQCRALRRNTGLVSARQGRGILGTWPSFFGPLRVGIDQMLVSPDIQVVACRVGAGIGSDHRPLITDLFVGSPGPLE